MNRTSTVQKRAFVEKRESHDHIDLAVYNFIKFYKPTSGRGVSHSSIAHNLDLTNEQVFKSVKRLNSKGIKFKKNYGNAKV
jgi:Mn-dependent DtxR family transcriptional regulator